MSKIISNYLESILIWLPILVGICATFGTVVAIWGALVARREAYDRKHQDFLNLKHRVQDELRKDGK